MDVKSPDDIGVGVLLVDEHVISEHWEERERCISACRIDESTINIRRSNLC